jgi:hypothetical protein
MTGEDAAKTVDNATLREQGLQLRCGAASQNASAISATDTSVIQIRGSPSRPVAPIAFGSPNIAMNG